MTVLAKLAAAAISEDNACAEPGADWVQVTDPDTELPDGASVALKEPS